MYTHTHTYIYIHIFMYIYTCMYIRIYIHVHICVTSLCARAVHITNKGAHVAAVKGVRVQQLCVRDEYMYIHIYKYICIHTYIHMCIYMSIYTCGKFARARVACHEQGRSCCGCQRCACAIIMCA